MKKPRITLNQTFVSAFAIVGAIVVSAATFNCSGKLMSASAATTQTSQSQPAELQHPGVSVDLTGVVVTALTLGFGYGVLKTFQGGGK